MLLIIHEDMTIKKTEKLTDDLRQGFKHGLIDLVNISNPDAPMIYASTEGDKWEIIEE